jgi:predicted permease
VSRVQLGIRTDSVVSFAVSPGQIGYDSTQSWTLFRRIEDELATMPEVVGVTGALVPVLRGWSNGNDVDVDGFPTTPGSDVNARTNYVGVEYFKTLGIPLLAGREFTAADAPGAPGVVIINEAFAKKFQLGSNPIGHRMRLGNALAPENRDRPRRDLEIVGLIKDAAYNEVKGEIPPVLYLAIRQTPEITRQVFYVRTRGAPTTVMGAIPPLVAKLEPNLPVADLLTLPQQVKENIYLDRMITTFSAGFALLATLLAAVGLYGVLAYTIAQRTHEIGLRMALGADAGQVRAMVIRQVGSMTLGGGVFGLAAAFAIGRSAQSLLYGLEGYDLVSFGGAAVLLTAVALAAGFIPARRASRVHPMEALRSE